jgi:alginate O-acetyltransferase complex protein AlgI
VFRAAASNPPWPLTFFEAWGGAVAFAYQIYFDFSGYSDMALGIALMFNVRLPINFNSPFQATSILDLWRRWHMTLTRFLTDYIFTPISLSLTRTATIRRWGKWQAFLLAVVIPINITFFVSGMWHGAGWNYILFGVVTGLALSINFAWQHKKGRPLPVGVAWPLTMMIFVVSIVYFRSETVAAADELLKAMFGWNGIALSPALAPLLEPVTTGLGAVVRFDDAGLAYGSTEELLILVGVTAFTLLLPNTQEILAPFHPVLDSRPKDMVSNWILGYPIASLYGASALQLFARWSWAAGSLLGLSIVGLLLYQSHFKDVIPQFIYFRF